MVSREGGSFLTPRPTTICCLNSFPPLPPGFFYMRYDPPATSEAGTETSINLNQQLAYHVVGTPQSDDVTVLAIPEHPEWMLGTEITHDGR
jgi:hypothetical protein